MFTVSIRRNRCAMTAVFRRKYDDTTHRALSHHRYRAVPHTSLAHCVGQCRILHWKIMEGRTDQGTYRLRTGRCIVWLLEHHYPECMACDGTLRILSLQCWCFVACYRSHITIFLMSFGTPRVYAMFGCNFTPGV